jgi:hypothetical protein
MADMPRDPARSYAELTVEDLQRLGRAAEQDLDRFFERNAHRAALRDRVAATALAQGGAEHLLRRRRGIWDLDVIVCFFDSPGMPNPVRRPVVSWDWGPSPHGRCPYDPPEYTGRAVDVKYWVIPDNEDPIESMRSWLEKRKHSTKPGADLSHEPVILLAPRLGEVIWDPGPAPPPGPKGKGHRRPAGLVGP